MEMTYEVFLFNSKKEETEAKLGSSGLGKDWSGILCAH